MKARLDRIPDGAYREQLRVRSYEVGRDGATHPSTLLRYLENLATYASAFAGFEPEWYVREGSAWVVRNMDIFIGELPRFGNHLGMATWVAEFRRVQAIRQYAIWNQQTGALIARAEARWAYIDRVRAVPLRLPDLMTAGFSTCGHHMAKRPITEMPLTADSISTTFDHVAHEYEVDSQQHINNCAYVDWLSEATHQALTQSSVENPATYRPRYYALEYVRPTLVNERVHITTRIPRDATRNLRIEHEILHEATGAVCLRGTAIYLKPFA